MATEPEIDLDSIIDRLLEGESINFSSHLPIQAQVPCAVQIVFNVFLTCLSLHPFLHENQ